MAEPFKNLINAQTVQAVAHHLHRVWPAFPAAAFERQAGDGLDALEFKARAEHLSAALQATLPEDFLHAADVLQASLKAVPTPVFAHDPDDELGSLATDDSGLGGWALWAFGDFTARRGLPHTDRALALLHAITQRFTAEFAIRPFIIAQPDRVFATLHQWQHDPSAHVRRSVANHLNDIAKDHPELLVSWLGEHLPGASACCATPAAASSRPATPGPWPPGVWVRPSRGRRR